jgi:NADPH-dependent 2,4-dienoyl-CoA reductase/sulfur reductase-like enzyme
MARVCSPEFARLIIERHAAAGVRFRFGTTITAASPAHDGIYLQLRDGEVIEAATVIVGVGATPAIALAVDAGLPTADGILVDDHCRSADPAIYAAGDVAEFSTRWCPQPTRLENWRHALDQGQIAGTNAAGGDEIYDAVPSFWSDQYDLMIQGAGWPDGLASRAVRRVLGADCLLEFHLRDGKVRYATGLGAARDINIARRLIARQITVAARKLADPTITLQTLLKV